MLAAIPALTSEINVGLGCVDHILNLVVQKALVKNEDVAEAVDACRNLASKTHKSDLYNNRIKKECEKLSKDDSRDGPGIIY